MHEPNGAGGGPGSGCSAAASGAEADPCSKKRKFAVMSGELKSAELGAGASDACVAEAAPAEATAADDHPHAQTPQVQTPQFQTPQLPSWQRRELRVPLGGEEELPAARAAVKFAYTGQIDAGSIREALQVRRQAAYLQMKGCVEACLAVVRDKLGAGGKGKKPTRASDANEEPAFTALLTEAKRQLVAHFGDALAVLNQKELYEQMRELPAEGLEALLESDDFGTDSESSVVLMLAEWMDANYNNTDVATRRRLCGLLRLVQCSRAYSCFILPELADGRYRIMNSDWLDLSQKELSCLNTYITAGAAERRLSGLTAMPEVRLAVLSSDGKEKWTGGLDTTSFTTFRAGRGFSSCLKLRNGGPKEQRVQQGLGDQGQQPQEQQPQPASGSDGGASGGSSGTAVSTVADQWAGYFREGKLTGTVTPGASLQLTDVTLETDCATIYSYQQWQAPARPAAMSLVSLGAETSNANLRSVQVISSTPSSMLLDRMEAMGLMANNTVFTDTSGATRPRAAPPWRHALPRAAERHPVRHHEHGATRATAAISGPVATSAPAPAVGSPAPCGSTAAATGRPSP
ncbi:hypothetical protein HYH02_003739 [Chlamydomonas schloesseri]|uniref:BACK domain-containing protein n=1 Tax=Chlamydomonas schloesseri TaxID=2026947 RepID=A0A835WSD5_9CHLO|nr:hypothetical protein HYH02_003739 [Chlamydomonas schloesseri]|eukprot:KAG2451966.1 hypothetical protein HYH02_003739 [Chlamydomonas schloesseri]